VKSFNLKTSLLGLATIALGLSACQTPPLAPTLRLPAALPPARLQQQQAGPEQIIAKANTVTFDKPVPVAVHPDRLVFQGAQNFQPNQILLGRSIHNEDFLRRVLSSRPEGNQVVVQTAPATLFEAFDELDLNGPRMQQAPERISLREHRFNLGGIVDIVLDMGITPDFSDTRLKIKDSRMSLRVAPEFQIEAQVRSEFRFSPLMSEVNLRPVGSVDFTAAKFVAWIGPVPLVFQLKPGAALDFGSQAQGAISVGTQLNGVVKASIEIDATLNQTPTTRTDSSQNFEASMLPPQMSMNGEVRSRLTLPRIHMESEIAGLVGPFVQVGPYIDAQYLRQLTGTGAGATVRERVTSHLGLGIYGGITPTRLFGKDLSREIRIRILDRQLKQIYHRDLTRPLAEGPA